MRAEFQQTGKETVLSRRLIRSTASLERGEQAMICSTGVDTRRG